MDQIAIKRLAIARAFNVSRVNESVKRLKESIKALEDEQGDADYGVWDTLLKHGVDAEAFEAFATAIDEVDNYLLTTMRKQ